MTVQWPIFSLRKKDIWSLKVKWSIILLLNCILKTSYVPVPLSQNNFIYNWILLSYPKNTILVSHLSSHYFQCTKQTNFKYNLKFELFSCLTIWKMCVCVCVFQCQLTSYYVLQVPHKADRWRWVWSIFESCTTSVTTLCVGWVSVCTVGNWDKGDCLCSCLCSVGWWWKEGRRWNPVPLIVCSSRKVPRGPPGLSPFLTDESLSTVSYYMPSQHIYCGRVWNLIQACDVQSSD